MLFASGSDDCSVKLYDVHEKKSICNIEKPTNVLCVQFSPYSEHLLAFGCSDFHIYGYDLRHTRIPWCTLGGHERYASYVKFLDSHTLVSLSVDNSIKIWDLCKTKLEGLSFEACTSTLTGHTNHMVIWVEQAEADEKVVHQVFNNYVSSGMAFGAQRWLAVLQRQCERLASLMARNIPDLGVIPSPEARRNLMNLAQRMIRTFCVSVSSSCGQSWTALSDSPDHTVRITTRKVTEPGQPNGLILSAVSTIWLPYPHNKVFDLLRDERRRAQLDVLSNGNSLHEVAHIANGSHPGNCISLLRVNVASNSSQNVELMLQESCTDESGSLVVYTTIDVEAVQMAMNGEDPSCIPLLPLGFIIVPMVLLNTNEGVSQYSSNIGNSQDSGCLLTVGLQVLANTVPTAKLNLSSVSAINNHICNTMHQISGALGNGNCSSTLQNGCVDGSLSKESGGAPPKLIDQNPKE